MIHAAEIQTLDEYRALPNGTLLVWDTQEESVRLDEFRREYWRNRLVIRPSVEARLERIEQILEKWDLTSDE